MQPTPAHQQTSVTLTTEATQQIASSSSSSSDKTEEHNRENSCDKTKTETTSKGSEVIVVPRGDSQEEATTSSCEGKATTNCPPCSEELADRSLDQRRQVGPKQLRNYTIPATTSAHPPSASQVASPPQEPQLVCDTSSSSSYSRRGVGSFRGERTKTTPVVLGVTGEGGNISRIPSDSIDSAQNNNNNNSSNDDTSNNSSRENDYYRSIYNTKPKHQHSIEASPVESFTDQNNLVDQRIKVTLSAPRNSTDIQTCEPILIDSTTTKPPPVLPAIVTSEGGSSGGGSSANSNRRRQSTATLISAFDSLPGEVGGGAGSCTQSHNPDNQIGSRLVNVANASGYVQSSSPVQVAPLSRSEQENELRRIASQRVKKQQVRGRPNSDSIVLPAGELGCIPNVTSATELQQTKPRQTRQNSTILKSQPQQQQQQSQLQAPEQNSKQLAIYINGKIRSNSIFCRSNSNNSFNGILQKFHVTNSNTSQGNHKASSSGQENSTSGKSPLKLCVRQASGKGSRSGRDGSGGKSKSRQAKRQHKSTATYASGGIRGGHLEANLRQNFNRLLTNCILPGHGRETRERAPELSGTGNKKLNCDSGHSTSGSESGVKTNKLVKLSSSSSLGQNSIHSIDSSISIGGQENVTSYKLNPSSMFLRKAMRYYRLWIYCTNITILIGTLIFILSAIYVMSDYRIKLLVSPSTSSSSSAAPLAARAQTANSQNQYKNVNPANGNSNGPSLMVETDNNRRRLNYVAPEVGMSEASGTGEVEYDISISYTEPYLILAYVVIAIQAGLLQAVGCFGAIRMKERWIQAFYYLILALIALDVMLLTGWLNRYDLIVKSLHDHMSLRLRQHYGAHDGLGSLLQPFNASANGGRGTFDSSRNHSENLLPLHRNKRTSDKNLARVSQEMNSKLDKILTEIIDKIQTDSKCCGITSSLDYKYSHWRRIKLERLKVDLNWTNTDGNPNIAHLMRVVPLVPASCCRRTPALGQQNSNGQKPVILDDSQIERPNRVPAWSPSMVVENLQHQQHSMAAKDRAPGTGSGKVTHYGLSADTDDYNEQRPDADDTTNGDGIVQRPELQEPTLADLIDGRWKWPTFGDSSSSENGVGKLERSLLAKQENFGRPMEATEMPYPHTIDHQRQRRWAVESMVDKEEQVLTRLIDDDDYSGSSGVSGEITGIISDQNGLDPAVVGQQTGAKAAGLNGGSRAGQQLEKLRQILFDSHDERLAAKRWCELNSNSCYGQNNFRWPNKLQLSFDQYKTIESYLVREKQVGAKANGAAGRQNTVYSGTGSREAINLADGWPAAATPESGPATDDNQLAGMDMRADASDGRDKSDEGLQQRQQQQQQNCTTNNKAGCKPLVRTTKSVSSGPGDDENENGAEIDGLTAGKLTHLQPPNNQHHRYQRQHQHEQQQQHGRQAASNQNSMADELKLLRETLLADPETSCAPRSYYDLETIYTRGCFPDIKSWLDSSAHILFVTGFCILTVLKFCSVVLLRLEIREMIHKIRVLKGMATEYNALHDLEAYLPRPSVCAEAAELTPSGVALTTQVAAPGSLSSSANVGGTASPAAAASNVGPTTATTTTGASAGMGGFCGPPLGPVYRLGGSFSEAVAAATAAAHSNAGSLGLGGLASSGRAASMKAVAAMSNMLTPSLCPRSSSASAAHLQAAASLLSAGSQGSRQPAGSLSLRSDPFMQANGMIMSRRHTAVSVCPAAAAAAAAAAHHLMSRRGTYVANPMFAAGGGGGASNVSSSLMSSGPNLYQHRHSAHTVSSLLMRPQPSQHPQVAESRQQQQHASKRSSRHHLGDTPSGGPQIEHQSSGESNQLSASQATTATTTTTAGCQQQQPPTARSSVGGSQQLLSLVYPFKRQSSGGAQSAGNFSLDLAPVLLAESRRSIH